MEPRATIRQGYLLLADISGYTAFLTQSELDHAQDILHSLFQTLLDEMKPPLVVCELEGDAVFAYAPDGGFLQGQTFVEIIENLFCAFTSVQERMQHNTTCTCTACRLIPTLGLKFVAHHGTFALQRLGGQGPAKPSGPDVILVHRLLKNRIEEETGVEAYAFFTDACTRALRLDAMAEILQPHTEHYEHLGKIPGYVYDLHPRWDRERAQRRITVAPEEAWMATEMDLPAAAPFVWDYLNDPERKRLWREADAVRVLGEPKRTGVGTVHHCVHGNTTIVEQIVDWRPFEYVTVANTWPMQASALDITRLVPQEDGTRLVCYASRPTGKNRLHTLLVRIVYAFLKKRLLADYTHSLRNLRAMIEADQATREAQPHLAMQSVT